MTSRLQKHLLPLIKKFHFNTVVSNLLFKMFHSTILEFETIISVGNETFRKVKIASYINRNDNFLLIKLNILFFYEYIKIIQYSGLLLTAAEIRTSS